MRRKINNYFLAGLLENARVFDVARIKLVYNFTIFYFVMNILGSVAFLDGGNELFAIWGAFISIVFTIAILFFFRNRKLTPAIFTYFWMHLIIGSCIFIFKKGDMSLADAGMVMVLMAFAFFTMGRGFGLAWMVYLVIYVGLCVYQDYSGGTFLNYETVQMPPDPVSMVFMPMVMLGYILWVYLKSKEVAEVQIEQQKALLTGQHLQITDSISYARRLQEAILPADTTEYLPESFVLFKPKDGVSGDFYWMEKFDDVVFVAVADCTGHGVPGAMVSMVGNTGLNKCVKELRLNDPGEILDHLNAFVEQTFSKTANVRDGMDISLCRIDLRSNTVHFAGANNPLYVISDGELRELKADKQPVGKHDNRKPFSVQTLSLKPGDSIYLFSDGYADQFGGPSGKKLKYKALKEILLSVHTDPVEQQQKQLDHYFENWKGKLEQVDDVCVIGIRL